MTQDSLIHKLLVFLSACMIIGGVALGAWALTHLPGRSTSETNAAADPAATEEDPATRTSVADSTRQPEIAETSEVSRTAQNLGAQNLGAQNLGPPLVVAVDPGLPASLATLVTSLAISNTSIVTTAAGSDDAMLTLNLDASGGRPIHRHYFAAATRFDTLDTDIAWNGVDELWQAELAPTDGAQEEGTPTEPAFTHIAVLTRTIPALNSILGEHGSSVRGYGDIADLTEAVWSDRETLALIPFDRLTPRLRVLALDGQNPIENANKFSSDDYPFVVELFAHSETDSINSRIDSRTEKQIAEFIAQLPATNRDPNHLTVVAMTGVTAMVRLTAAQMDRFGSSWPAEVVGAELASADITAISNEVPFVPGCETNTDPDNLVFCSDPDYLNALTDSGVDIIGLTGNHQNDYGRENALESLAIYAQADLPVYGGGVNKEAAFTPLVMEHNGNKLAFLGANSYGPKFAWATDSQPGSAEFDLAIMSATIRNLKANGIADIVLAELQYQESYNVVPLFEQRQDFTALVRAGADIVTGVQSHVPQAIEFNEEKMILYGLGNLFFDQMWSQATRDGLIVKHTIYDGRHISTQLFTTLLHEYGQPRWTELEDNRRILERIFSVSYW